MATLVLTHLPAAKEMIQANSCPKQAAPALAVGDIAFRPPAPACRVGQLAILRRNALFTPDLA